MNIKNSSYKLALIFLILVFSCSIAVTRVFATKPVYKVCTDCHTAHASQEGLLIRLGSADEVGLGKGECLDCHSRYRAMLLKMDCIGCHARNVSGSSTIVSSTPQVAHAASTNLAGGNFTYVFGDANTSKGHNVHGFGTIITKVDLGNEPPGYDSAYDPSSLKYDPSNAVSQMMCAGSNGCHGSRDQSSHIEAMRGAHHADDSVVQLGNPGFNGTGQGGTVGESYRFLLGVNGGEAADWENNVSASNHNEYKGASSPSAPPVTYASINTISEFCAECHGNFHQPSGVGTDPWLRHPSDVVVPSSGEYTGYTAYNPKFPLGRQTLPNPSTDTVNLGSDTVMCLSCHRAHASPYAKMLRWNYASTTLATALEGCAACHTSMN